MSAATTKLANLALSHLGARPLAELDTDTSVEAASCRLHYLPTLYALLRMHQWNFATARAALAVDSIPPAEWSSAWTLPDDCLRLIRICGATPEAYVDRFSIEGRLLLLDVSATEDPDTHEVTSTETVSIVYISSDVAPESYDSIFSRAFAYMLASEIAQDVTQNPNLAQEMLTHFRSIDFQDAIKADAREVASGENFGPRAAIARSPLVASRYTRSY